MARTLVNAHQLAPFSGSTANQVQVDSLLYSGPGSGAAKDAALNMTSGSIDKVGTLYFSDGTTGVGGSIAYDSSKVQIYGNTNIEGTLTANTSLTLDSTTFTTAELGVLDGVTAGTAAASKAVVLDGSKNIATIGTIGCGAITSTGNSGFGQVTTSGRVIIDDATDATSTTDGSLQTDGGLSVAKDAVIGDDLKLLSDSAVLSFGADSDVTLTHVADQALVLNGAIALSFGDAGTYVQQVSDGILKLASDNTVLVSSDTVSIESANANDPLLQMKNTNADGNGSIFRFTKDGASVADNDVIGVVEFVSEDDADNSQTYAQMVATIADASSGAEGGRLEFKVAEHDGSVTTGLKLQDGDADGEIDVTIGAGANSVVTIPGNLTVTGTTTTVNTVTMEAANAVIFEGATADSNETTLTIVDPTGDRTIKLPDQSGCIPVLAADSTTAITSTPAELNLLDGGTAVGGSITIADGDGMIIHDNGTMKTIPMSDVKTYVAASLDIDGYSALGGTGLHQTQDHFVFSDNGTEKKITFSNLQDAIFADVSGDATIAAGGALTIAAASVENSMLADDAVGADELAANAVVNASVVDGALKADKLDIDGSTDIGADLVDADLIIVDDGAGGTNRKSTLTRVKKYVYSAVSGDATVSDAGALTIAANAVEGSMLNANVISGQTDIGGNLAATDELLVSDNGVLRRTDLSRIATLQAGDGLGASSGVLAIDFNIDSCQGSSGAGYASATGVYTLGETPVSGSEMVFLNGQLLMPNLVGDNFGKGEYTTATGSVELHPDLKLDGDDVLRVYYLGT